MKNNVKEERLKHGLSQEQLAEAAGISRTGLSLIENGLTEPKIDTLKKIGAVMNVKWEELANRQT